MVDDTTDGPEGIGTDSSNSGSTSYSEGRRRTDRRRARQPFDGPDQRTADRRAGTDRRATPRAEGLESADD